MASSRKGGSTRATDAEERGFDLTPEVVAHIVSEVVAALRDRASTAVANEGEGTRQTLLPSAAGEGLSSPPPAFKNIPFIREFNPKEAPFAELGSRSGVDDPERMLKGFTESAVAPEAAIGREITSHAALLQILAERRRAVAVINAEGVNYKGENARWSGTGFLVAPNLLLTNHHVLNSIAVAHTARVEFDFEISASDLLADTISTRPKTRSFALNPSRLFLTSPLNNGLDYTFVWIEDAAAAAYGFIAMERASYTAQPRDRAFIIHHPDGKVKRVSLDDADVVGPPHETLLYYSSDTMTGSSGAPVFDRLGRLIALHHAELQLVTAIDLEDGRKTDVINEGIKFSAIAMDVQNIVQGGGANASPAAEVLKEFKGSDTNAGFFGAAGRKVEAAATTHDTVVRTYLATDQDIDIGFWKLEAATAGTVAPEIIDGVAMVLADLNLDACAFTDAAPKAVSAIVMRVKEKYGNTYAYDFSEPADGPGERTTAVMWKTSSLKGGRIDWPESVEPLFRLKTESGDVFSHFPGLFRFENADPSFAFSFHAIPLRLDGADESGVTRRLAVRIVTRAFETLSRGSAIDAVIGGETYTPIDATDFSAIEKAGFAAFSASDAGAAAFTYIKAPNSTIREVFLPAGMRQSTGATPFFTIAKDLAVPDYSRVSKWRPVVARLSLAPKNESAAIQESQDIDALIETLLASNKDRAPRKTRTTLAANRTRVGRT